MAEKTKLYFVVKDCRSGQVAMIHANLHQITLQDDAQSGDTN